MKLYVDLETLQLIEGPGFRNPVTVLRFKRGDAAKLDVSFLEGGTTAIAIGDPGALEIHFGIKPRNRYDIGYLVHDENWTMPDAEAENPVYQCSPSFNTLELDSALGVGSSTGSELSEITLMGEITWREDSGEPTSTRTFLVVVENDVNRGTEGVPVSAAPPYPPPGNLVTTGNLGDRAVRHDMGQTLSPTQQAQARGNIGLQPLAPLLQSPITAGHVPLWDGTNWTPQAPPAANYWSFDDGNSYTQFESAYGSSMLRFTGPVGGSGSYLAAISIIGDMLSGGQIGAYDYNLCLSSGYGIHLRSSTTLFGDGSGSNHWIGPAGSDVLRPSGSWDFTGATVTGLGGGGYDTSSTGAGIPFSANLGSPVILGGYDFGMLPGLRLKMPNGSGFVIEYDDGSRALTLYDLYGSRHMEISGGLSFGPANPVGGRGTLPPAATDLPSAITLLNAIRTLLGNSTGYALADL